MEAFLVLLNLKLHNLYNLHNSLHDFKFYSVHNFNIS